MTNLDYHACQGVSCTRLESYLDEEISSQPQKGHELGLDKNRHQGAGYRDRCRIRVLGLMQS